MNLQAIRLMAAMTAIGFFLLPSCTKQYEYLETNPDEIGQFCRVDSLMYGPFGPTLNIIYNASGNPVEQVPADPNSSLAGNDFHWRYDKYGRLTDQLVTSPGQTFVFTWLRYFYPGPGIIGDTFYEYNGHLSDANPPPGTAFTSVEKYYLDEKGRTFKTIYKPILTGEPIDTFYTLYDKNGNKVVPGIVYDDKINVYRTNRIWQFLYQDYSMNNPIYPPSPLIPPIPVAYDKYGLPLVLHGNVDAGGGVQAGAFDLVYTILDLKYSCDSKPTPQIPPSY